MAKNGEKWRKMAMANLPFPFVKFAISPLPPPVIPRVFGEIARVSGVIPRVLRVIARVLGLLHVFCTSTCTGTCAVQHVCCRLVRRRRTPPPPGDFVTPNAAGTPPAYIGVRRVFL